MAGVTIRGLEKRFGEHAAVAGIDLDVAEGEFVTLLGPSGCGKTTTLRCLAGLELPTAGRLEIDGRVVADPARGTFVPPERRRVGMVFQSYALWPHMTVAGNVAYPLKLAKVPAPEIRTRVREILAQVGLDGREDRQATSLSGGQQQRVALARAMVARPRLVFFDEPLSNLDAALRYSMRQQIRSLHDAYGTTSVYVTHDQEEAIALADRIVVMNEGRIEQVGTPRELYARPATAFVAGFMGFQNVWPGVVVDSGGVRIDGTGLVVRVPPGAAPAAGTPVRVAFRGAHLRVASGGPGAQLRGPVLSATYLGSAVNLLVDLGGGLRLRSQLGEVEMGRLGEVPAVGDEVALELPADHVVVLPGDRVADAATMPDAERAHSTV